MSRPEAEARRRVRDYLDSRASAATMIATSMAEAEYAEVGVEEAHRIVQSALDDADRDDRERMADQLPTLALDLGVVLMRSMRNAAYDRKYSSVAQLSSELRALFGLSGTTPLEAASHARGSLAALLERASDEDRDALIDILERLAPDRA